MKIKNSIILLFLWGMVFFPTRHASAQVDSDHLNLILDSLFTELESTSFLDLIDSLLNVQEPAKSEVMIRFAFLSKVSTLGRDMGIDQYGLSPSLSYFHKSGLFTDITGYWNSGDSVSIDYTMLSLGYIKYLTKIIGINLSYDHSFYNEEGYNLINSINLANYLSFDLWELGIDYSFLFGTQTAHRFNLNLSGYLPIKKILFFDRVTFSPKVSAMMGTANSINENYTLEQINRFSPVGDFQIGRGQKPNQVPSSFYYNEEKKVFGVMNYNFSLPVRFKIKKLNMVFNYNYNIPVSLSGEAINFPSYSYYLISAAYRIEI